MRDRLLTAVNDALREGLITKEECDKLEKELA